MMDLHGGPGGGGGPPGVSNPNPNVPAFLTKLWMLVEDPDTDDLICWSPSGSSFHVLEHARFSKDVLPKFFKHNNMASFIRQLNMYGFRKVVHMEHGGLLKPEKEDTEFQHPFFSRGQQQLLDHIKRKVPPVSSGKQEEGKVYPEEVSKILNDMQLMKGKQENIDSKITTMKHENEALWREVATLRQKHAQQQKVVNKLIQFLVSLVQPNRVIGMKRKLPLMLSDSSSTHSIPKYSRQYSLEPLQATPAISAPAGSVTSGPIISDITELVTPTSTELSSDWIDAPDSPVILVKEEPSSPDLKDTPLSPTTFFNSILMDHEGANPSAANRLSASPSMELGSSSTAVDANTQSGLPDHAPSHPDHAPRLPDHAPRPSPPEERCLSVACLDSALYCRSELSEHLEDIDSSLENLHHLLNGQNINIDSSPLFEFFSSPGSACADFDLDSLDTLLSPETPRETDGHSASEGKQLVQYSTTPILMPEPMGCLGGVADLPSLLQLQEDSFYSPPLPEDHPSVSTTTTSSSTQHPNFL
ncbi:heat shock factor protein 1 isoform X1 [Gadus morhua]|uniref:heat shock factor protein 1 isoform X1 n=1 Tax=Gadus morhua TaxID=8049 RepID=UPI0011B75FFC|nr:heat shock factor protein 1 isoform X1 [Gadus morhua]